MSENTSSARVVAQRHLNSSTAALISLWVKPFQYSLEDISHGGDLVVVSTSPTGMPSRCTGPGVTADTSQAVLGENTSRAALYVAMTRSRESNSAYLYERPAEASEYSDAGPDGRHVLRRGSSRGAARLFGQIIATDARAQTAHELAAETGRERLPARVAELLIDRRTHTVQMRRAAYRQWCSKTQQRSAGHEQSAGLHLHQSLDYSLEL